MKSLKVIAAAALAASTITVCHLRDARADAVVVSDTTTRSTGTRPSRAMLGTGVFVFGVPYVTSVVVAAESDHPGDKKLYVPVAGPWMDLADRHCRNGGSCDDGVNKGLLVVDGVFQGIGALDIIGAFLFPETVTVATARRDKPPSSSFASVKVGPTRLGAGGYGVAAIGAF